MSAKSPCQVCREPVHEITKRFDKDQGFVCPECCGFMSYSVTQLRKVGIEGCASLPQRFLPDPNPELP